MRGSQTDSLTSSKANINSKHLSEIFSSVRLFAVPATSGTTIGERTSMAVSVDRSNRVGLIVKH